MVEAKLDRRAKVWPERFEAAVAAVFVWARTIEEAEALASLAIVVFFLREKTERGFWTTKAAPAVSLVLVVAVLVIALQNYDAMLFSEGATAKLLLWLIPIAFALGAVLPRLKKDIDYDTVTSAAA